MTLPLNELHAPWPTSERYTIFIFCRGEGMESSDSFKSPSELLHFLLPVTSPHSLAPSPKHIIVLRCLSCLKKKPSLFSCCSSLSPYPRQPRAKCPPPFTSPLLRPASAKHPWPMPHAAGTDLDSTFRGPYWPNPVVGGGAVSFCLASPSEGLHTSDPASALKTSFPMLSISPSSSSLPTAPTDLF